MLIKYSGKYVKIYFNMKLTFIQTKVHKHVTIYIVYF